MASEYNRVMSDLDFTQPQEPAPPAPASPQTSVASVPFKAAQSQFYNASVAAKIFQLAGKRADFTAGQTLFAEDDKSTKGGLLSLKSATRMFFLADGEVALTMGGRPLDTLKPGEVFGEMAVISERPRTATATAKTTCVAYSLDAAELQDAVGRMPEFALMLMSVMFDRLRFIAARLAARKAAVKVAERQGPQFEPKLLEQFEAALARSATMKYNASQTIMREGQTGTQMYVVKSGQVAITLQGGVVEVVNPGGTFGEMAILDQSPRTAGATAVLYTELLAIDRASLLEAIRKQPVFAMAMLRAVAERLRHMNAQLA